MNRIPGWLKNKYVLTGICMLCWLGFFDRYDFITQYRTLKELEMLRHDRDYLSAEIEKNKTMMASLQSDPAFLEKYGRETYLMKKESEDVFIIIDQSEQVKQPE